MFKKLNEAAQSLKEKVDVAQRIEVTMQLAADKCAAGKLGASAAWENHWPAVEQLLVEGLLTVAEEKLKDHKALEGVFLKFYETLPLAVRFVLSRERFVEFTMSRRDPLLLKLQDYRAGRAIERESQLKIESKEGADARD